MGLQVIAPLQCLYNLGRAPHPHPATRITPIPPSSTQPEAEGRRGRCCQMRWGEATRVDRMWARVGAGRWATGTDNMAAGAGFQQRVGVFALWSRMTSCPQGNPRDNEWRSRDECRRHVSESVLPSSPAPTPSPRPVTDSPLCPPPPSSRSALSLVSVVSVPFSPFPLASIFSRPSTPPPTPGWPPGSPISLQPVQQPK